MPALRVHIGVEDTSIEVRGALAYEVDDIDAGEKSPAGTDQRATVIPVTTVSVSRSVRQQHRDHRPMTSLQDSCEPSSSPAPPASSARTSSACSLNRGEPVKLVAFDKLTYAGNLANLQDLLATHPDQLVFVKGDICDAAAVDQGVRRARRDRGRPLRRREPRRSLDPRRPGRSCRRTSSARRCCSTSPRRRSVEKFLYVSTDEVYGTLPEDQPEVKFTEETPLAAEQPVQRQQGRRRLPGAVVLPHVPHAGADDAVQQQLRPVPLPRKADPAVRHEPDGRQEGPALRRRHERPRLALRRRPLRRDLDGAEQGHASARRTTSAATTR